MQPNKTTQDWGGWLKAAVFMWLLIGLLAGTIHMPSSAAGSFLPPQNAEIVRGDWGPEEPAEDSSRDSHSPQGYDATSSIPITLAQPGEDPVVLNLVQVPQDLVDLWWSSALSRVNR